MNDWIFTAILTLLPIAELRGGLPYALAKGIPLALAYPYCVILNSLVAPIAYLFLDYIHRLLSSWPFYIRIFNKITQRASHKVSAHAERYGFWGLAVFVAIPLPVTGAWTATLGAWMLGFDRKRTALAVLTGVIISGAIVSTVFILGIEALNFLIRKT